MDLATKSEKTQFLSYEFLAWLAARTELDLGLLGDEKDPAMEVWIEKKVVLTEWEAPAEAISVRTEEPTASFEAKTALRLGKWIREAQVGVIHHDMEWHFQVSAPELQLRGVKIKTEFKKGEEGAVLDRVSALEDLLALWDRFVEAFLAVRLDPDAWNAEVARIGAWILS